MPKTKTDYSRCIIYKIVCNDLEIKDLYVGSTTEFTKRKYKHKNNCININSIEYNFKVYDFIRNNGGWNNWIMIEIEKFPCNDGNEARARERYWCETLSATLNDRTPYKIIIEKPTKTYKTIIEKPTKTYKSYNPCRYKYPDYYKNCKKYKYEDILIQNQEYFEKIKNKL